MKRIRVIVLAFSLAAGSCGEYLDIVPDNVATIENAFTMRNTAEKFLFTCYSYLPKGGNYVWDPAVLGADELWTIREYGSNQVLRGFQTVADPWFDYWSGRDGVASLYMGIRDCNIFLANVDQVLDATELERRRWAAEVKFLKAYYHFHLLRYYGPIPLVRENMPISASVAETKVKRQPVDDCFAYVVELLDEAIPELPPIIQAEATEMGRITRVIALSVKAKALVLAASPLFNGNSDYASFKGRDGTAFFNQTVDPDKWRIAAEACKAAIDAANDAGHKLYYYHENEPNASFVSPETNVKMNIRYAVTDRWNPEIIWGNVKSLSAENQREAQARLDGSTSGLSVSSTLGATLKMVEMFYSNHGVPITEDKAWDYGGRYDLKSAGASERYYIKEGYQTVKLNFDREPRFYASLGFDGSIWYGQGRLNEANSWFVEAKFGQNAGGMPMHGYSATGYWPKKLVHPESVYSSTVDFSIVNYPNPEIRLADLYLLYAETINESQGPVAEALHYIDEVRARAGLAGVEESWSAYSNRPDKYTTKEGLREIIHGERAIELAFEGHRSWDLKRWKKSMDELNYRIQGWDITQEEARAYYTVSTIFNRKFYFRDYFWPIRELELVRNKNLVQNPGW